MRFFVFRSLPGHHSLYNANMPVLGKNHGNERAWTREGFGGFRTRAGHFLFRCWGDAGAAICGATVVFKDDPIVPGASNEPLAKCCAARWARTCRTIAAKEAKP